MNIAIILAGGSGTRMGSETPKQYLTFNNKMLLEHTLEVFEQHPLIHQIIVVVHHDYLAFVRERAARYSKCSHVVAGGTERCLSTYEALKVCQAPNDYLLIHDAARPFVSHELINRLLDAAQQYDGAIPAIPLSDTLLEVHGECVAATPPRSNYQLAQTPQAFRAATLHSAFERMAQEENYQFTDDCSVVLHYLPTAHIHIIEGDKNNLKLTYASDKEYFERLFLKKSKK